MRVVQTFEFEEDERAKLDELTTVQRTIEEAEARRDVLVRDLVGMGVTRAAIEQEAGVSRSRLQYATQRARGTSPT